MFAGGGSHTSPQIGVELYSLQAGIYRLSHPLPQVSSGATVVQTSSKTMGGYGFSNCQGKDGGKILVLGGNHHQGSQFNIVDQSLVFSFQHGWLEVGKKMPGARTNAGILVIP